MVQTFPEATEVLIEARHHFRGGQGRAERAAAHLKNECDGTARRRLQMVILGIRHWLFYAGSAAG